MAIMSGPLDIAGNGIGKEQKSRAERSNRLTSVVPFFSIPTPVTDLIRLNRLNPQVTVIQSPSRGHYARISQHGTLCNGISKDMEHVPDLIVCKQIHQVGQVYDR